MSRGMLLTRAGRWKVTSCADGSYILHPRYVHPGAFGIFTRMTIAAEIERLLNAAYRKELAASKRRKGK